MTEWFSNQSHFKKNTTQCSLVDVCENHSSRSSTTPVRRLLKRVVVAVAFGKISKNQIVDIYNLRLPLLNFMQNHYNHYTKITFLKETRVGA